MARDIAPGPGRPGRHASATRAFARAGSALICGAAADIVHEMLVQSMLTTGAAAAVACALASLAVRLARAVRTVVVPQRAKTCGTWKAEAARETPSA